MLKLCSDQLNHPEPQMRIQMLYALAMTQAPESAEAGKQGHFDIRDALFVPRIG